MLEGFLPRDLIKLCRAPNGSRNRFNLLMKGELEATTLTEPLHHARREEGLPHHLLGVLSTAPRSPPTGSTPRPTRLQPRGARGGAADQREQARLPALLHRLSQAKRTRRSATLKPEDLRESRIVVCDPAPIPLDEMQRTYEWVKSWGMLEQTASPLQLVNADVQRFAHVAAE